jgi:beta-glucuronidase
VFLRGISIHDEAPGTAAGRMRSVADARALLTWAKELGCNFVRLAHYPHPELMVREAERMGLMVWSEIPVYWTIQWENPDTRALALRQLEGMIRRDRNRAAVVLWSVGNETPVGPARNRFMSDLVRRARELDSTRLLSAALEQHAGDVRIVDDPLGAELDVLGLNEYIGWYDGPPEKARTLTWKTQWQKPLVISEFGADAKRGHHGRDDERWTEEYQAFVYREQLAMLQKIPNLRGLSPWILKDFRSPRRWLPDIQDGWNRKGLVDETGGRKLAWTVLNELYRTRAERREP